MWGHFILSAQHFQQIRINFRIRSHPRETFLSNQDAFPRRKSSLQELFFKSGSIFPLEIIPTRLFLQIRINFPAGNHPSETFPANQDQFPRWKSSLSDILIKSGCIPPTKIIPTRLFLQIRINFPVGNHPYKSFSSNQDAFPRLKSSLSDILIKPGCIPPTKIIPTKLFLQIRMHSPAGNHLSQTFLANLSHPHSGCFFASQEFVCFANSSQAQQT